MDDEIAERGEVVKKLYAERDIIGLGQIYCDHVMAMTAEELHAKSDIAAELAFRDAALAAKDREISSARTMLARCQGGMKGVLDVFPGLKAAEELLADINAAIARIDAMKGRP